jgi:hypothetical protein
MMWGQRVKVYTDHKNLMQKALDYILEEFGPEIVWI